jgi:hypothetical protein
MYHSITSQNICSVSEYLPLYRDSLSLQLFAYSSRIFPLALYPVLQRTLELYVTGRLHEKKKKV